MDTFSFANLPGCRCCSLAGGPAPGFEKNSGFSPGVHSKFSEVSATGLVHKGVSSIHREKCAVPLVETLWFFDFAFRPGPGLLKAWVGGSPLRGYCCLDKPALPIDLSGLQRVKS